MDFYIDCHCYRFLFCSIKATRPKICKKSVCFYCITTSLWRTPDSFVWLRITNKGSVSEIRVWFILLIKSVLDIVFMSVEVSFDICM